MKKKIVGIIYIVLIIIIIKLLCNYILNSILINKYNKYEYSEENAKVLQIANFVEPYIAHYNMGNILYKKGEYEKANEEYKNALKGMPMKDKECQIRINYALSICKTVQVDESDSESIKNAIKTYESAIDVLTEKGCANKNDNNGHSKNAEQLKKDIQDEIDRLKKISNQSEDNTNNNEELQNNDNNKQQAESIEEKIQDIKQQATKDQREVESKFKNYSNYDYNRVEKNW